MGTNAGRLMTFCLRQTGQREIAKFESLKNVHDFSGTSFLRAHAAAHDVKNSSRMKKADVVKLLADHYASAHNHRIVDDLTSLDATGPSFVSVSPTFIYTSRRYYCLRALLF